MTTSPSPLQPSRRIAVVGSGVAGLTVAYLAQQRHRITLWEKNDYVGGHTNTVLLPSGPDAGTPVDTGFIVLNDKTYPLFTRLLARLGCNTQDGDMSFGFFSEETGLQYAGTGFNGLFAQRRNLLNPRYLSLLREIMRFCGRAQVDLRENRLAGVTVGDYLGRCGYSPMLRSCYILPMAAAIWSASQRDMDAFPAEMLIRFWDNHGLLSLQDRPRWMTVAGGSQTYVRKILSTFTGEVRLGSSPAHVRREAEGVVIRTRDGAEHRYDAVVLAAHADESLALLADPSDAERRLLGAWRYQENRTVLHTDAGVMPPNPRAWASWNYVHRRGFSESDPVPVTYHMNRLQRLQTQQPYFVTLNAGATVRPDRIVREFTYLHPLYTFGAMGSQAALPQLNGVRNTYFCGSYFGYGFHEDAVRSGVAVARALGTEL